MPQINTKRFEPNGLLPTILLVDDETVYVDALCFRLESRGYTCLKAAGGAEALLLVERPEIEIVLLDLYMPGLPGLEVLPQIRQLRPDIEVILLSGEADLSVVAQGMRRGAGDYLVKPIDFDKLLLALDKAFKRVAKRRESVRALQASKLHALGVLAEGVGHEINNPLQIIVQRAEWLDELLTDAKNGQPDYAEMGKSALVIKEQAIRLGLITAQLLSLTGNLRLQTADTSLKELLDRIYERFSQRAEAGNITLQISAPEDMPKLPWSATELELVLVNLLKNAFDALESEFELKPELKYDDLALKQIKISISTAGGSLRIVVADSGQGIAPQNTDRIFEPFFSTRPVGKGVGLGLTVCHNIVTALRGKLSYRKAEKKGSIFIVDFPENE